MSRKNPSQAKAANDSFISCGEDEDAWKMTAIHAKVALLKTRRKAQIVGWLLVGKVSPDRDQERNRPERPLPGICRPGRCGKDRKDWTIQYQACRRPGS